MSLGLKFNTGGIADLFVMPTNPLAETQSKETGSLPSKSTESNNDHKVGIKDLLSLTKDLKALPIDRLIVLKLIEKIYSSMDIYDDGNIDTSLLIRGYFQALQLVGQATSNYEEFEQAKKQVDASGGLNEIAIDKNGNIFVQDKESGQIGSMSVEEYKKLDLNKYEVLTNSNLLYYRKNDPQFALKNAVLDVVSNGIGTKQVTALLMYVADNLGSTYVKEGSYASQAAKGVEVLLEAANKLLKIEQLSKDLQKQATAALRYLWNFLPENAKTLLKYKSNNKENPELGALLLMQDLVFSRTSTQVEYNESLSGGHGGSGSGSGGKGDTNDKVNFYTNMQNQEGGTYGTFELNQGTGNSLLVEGTVYGNIQDNNWKPIGRTSMREVLDSGLSGIVSNMNGISFGNRVLNSEDLDNIMYDGNGGIVVELPIKMYQGAKVVDLSILDEYETAHKEYLSKKGSDPSSNVKLWASILEAHGLSELLDENGLPNKARFSNFLIVTGYAVDKNAVFYKSNDGRDNDFIEEVDDDDALIELIKKTLSKNSDKPDYKIDEHHWWEVFESKSQESFWGVYDHIYKGNLYIPLSDNEVASHTAGKETQPYYLQHEQERQYQIRQKRKTASRETSAGILNM